MLKSGACFTALPGANSSAWTSTEGVPGRGYRHIVVEADDTDGRLLQAVAYMAQGQEADGKPSLRYIMLLREGARAHGLPEQYIRFLENVEQLP